MYLAFVCRFLIEPTLKTDRKYLEKIFSDLYLPNILLNVFNVNILFQKVFDSFVTFFHLL